MSDVQHVSSALSARSFAFRVHAGHTRGNKARQPYVYHLEEVAALVEIADGDVFAIAAAWLHDVVEDTPVTLADIIGHFGPKIGNLVDVLTDPVEFSSLPLLERKTRQAARLASKGQDVRRIKLADQVSNVRCIGVDPPVDWDRQKNLDYIEGALRIARNCFGVSMFLDRQFAEAHAVALKKHTAER